MTHLFRLIFVALFLMATQAHALLPKVQAFRYSNSVETSAYIYDSAQAACTAGYPSHNAVIPVDHPRKDKGPMTAAKFGDWRCYASDQVIGGSDWTFSVYASGTICPANTGEVTGGCQCNAGFDENVALGFCVPKASELEQFCYVHSTAKHTFRMAGANSTSTPQQSCYVPDPPFEGADADKGCLADLVDQVVAPQEDGKRPWSATGTFTGAVCSQPTTPEEPAPTEPPVSKDDKCPGGFLGTVNGEEKCVPVVPGQGIEGVKKSSSTDANGTVHDVKETTKCEGGQCTTTTVTTSKTSSNETTTTTTSKTESMEDKCAKDATSSVCKKASGGGPSGECANNPSGAGCGGGTAQIGELYEGKDKTVSDVLNDAKQTLQNSPIGTAMSSFFVVSGGGSCPSSSWSIPYINATVTMDAFCSPSAASILAVIKGVLLVVAGFMAFRIAVDN